jgi:hypothetical protein
MTSDRLILCLPEDEFEMREVSSHAAPLAVIVRKNEATENETTIEYRTHEGTLYTRMPPMPQHLADEYEYLPDGAILKPGHPIFGDIAEDLRSAIGHRREAIETRPERLYATLSSSFISGDMVARAVTDAQTLVETETSASTLAFWREKARRRFSEIVLIDGEQWQATDEPVYQLDIASGVVRIHGSKLFESGPITAYRYQAWDWEDMRRRYFSPFDLDGARACRDTAEHINCHIEVILPEVIRNDYPALEIDRASRICVRWVELHLNSLASKHPAALKEVPRELLKATCRLRDELAPRNPHDPVDTTLAAALETYLDVVERHPQFIEDIAVDDIRSIRSVLDAWCAGQVHTPKPRPSLP